MSVAAHAERLPPTLADWLRERASALDDGSADPEPLIAELAGHELFRIAVPEAWGGLGGTLRDAVESLASVAERSLTAAFVLWGQRTFIEYVQLTPNETLRERFLAPLLDGRLAGATGLSNAMKFLSGIEELQAKLSVQGGSLVLDGKAPWVTNLRKSGFLVALTASAPDGDGQWVLAVPSANRGVQRSGDFGLLGLGSSNTAALRFERAEVSLAEVLHHDARTFIAAARPAFLGLQCGLAIGLARASLSRGRGAATTRAGSTAAQIETTQARLSTAVNALEDGLVAARFVSAPRALFELRIELARIAQAAVELELRASGGSAYLSEHDHGFARRWREAAFVPIVTPSLAQLEHELEREGART